MALILKNFLISKKQFNKSDIINNRKIGNRFDFKIMNVEKLKKFNIKVNTKDDYNQLRNNNFTLITSNQYSFFIIINSLKID